MTCWIPFLLASALASFAPELPRAGAVAPPPSDAASNEFAPTPDDGRGTPYIVNKSDNICGLDEPRQISTPAKVDYDALLEATAEVQKIRKEGIDPNSSQGITLMTQARSRVLKACESIRTDKGYDSVWKSIARRDKKSVDDVTDAVKAKLASSGGSLDA